jgi:hypothetical protein
MWGKPGAQFAECSAVAALLSGSREMQCDGFECRDLLHASRAGWPYCFAALYVGLRPPQALEVWDRPRSRAALGTFAKRRRAHWVNQQGTVAGLDRLQLVRYKLELVRHSAELGKRTGLHLPHCSASMDFYRRLGDADIAGNLFAEAAARDLNHDLALPGT